MSARGAAAAIALGLFCMSGSLRAGAEEVTLTFIWHAGDRAELLRKISEQYTRETGVKVAARRCRSSGGKYLRASSGTVERSLFSLLVTLPSP